MDPSPKEDGPPINLLRKIACRRTDRLPEEAGWQVVCLEQVLPETLSGLTPGEPQSGVSFEPLLRQGLFFRLLQSNRSQGRGEAFNWQSRSEFDPFAYLCCRAIAVVGLC